MGPHAHRRGAVVVSDPWVLPRALQAEEPDSGLGEASPARPQLDSALSATASPALAARLRCTRWARDIGAESGKSLFRCPTLGGVPVKQSAACGRLMGVNAIFVFLQAELSCSEGGELTVVKFFARLARGDGTSWAGRGGLGSPS